ncbi:MAG: hypothetical protein WCF68_05290 [Terriglobales bacterium]
MTDGSKVCLEIYAKTRRFLHEDLPKEDSSRLKKTGFQILMGPPHPDAPILFIGYQPGDGQTGDRTDTEEDRYPETCEYATACWCLAARLRAIFDESLLLRSVGLNAIFVRAESMEVYRRDFSSKTRREIKNFCIGCVLEIIGVVRPKKIVVIGLSTLDLLRKQATCWKADVQGLHGRTLTKTGKIDGHDAIAVMHLSGAHMTNDDRGRITRRLQKFCISR